jgi:transcriptional regulator with GAF, ATPase, and Fis domain
MRQWPHWYDTGGRATCASWRTSWSGSGSCILAETSTRGRCGADTILPDPTTLHESLTETLDEHERTLIVRALSAAAGNVAEASRRLKTDRANLYRRMRRLGIPIGDE